MISQHNGRSDFREATAAVMSAGARPLAELVTEMSGEGLFGYMDDVLAVLGPAALERSGSLTGIENGAVTAVFEDSCEDALMCAVTACQRIATGAPALFPDFAAGISYGTVFSDHVGSGGFRTPLTISACTTQAQRLRGAAARYNAHILITQSAAQQIPGFHTRFNSRCLGSILFSATGEREVFYDVFDGDSIAVKNSKRRGKLFFEAGVRLFEEGNFETARSYFIELIKADRDDRGAKAYLYACDSLLSGETSNIRNIEIW